MSELVLITGGTGFVGFKTILTALEAGYAVRAVIRKPEQGKQLKTHAKLAPFATRLDFVVVPELTKEGAFDDVLSDVVAILHIASPLAIETDNYDRDIINPAIQMNTSLLHSALKAPTVKRVVITSSAVTLIPFSWLANPDSRIYTAADLNPRPTRSVAHPMEAYWSSKALARIAVREFVGKHNPHFETIQLLPGVIIGPDDRATSVAYLRQNTPQWALRMSPVLGTRQTDPMVSVPVAVADVARAHVDAVKGSVPGNADYALTAESPEGVEWDSMIDVAKRYFGDRVGSEKLPLGGTLATMKWRVDSRGTEEAFGWGFESWEDTMKAMIGQYLELVDAGSKERDL